VSIGTRKRAGLARALVINPDAILIDEPNTGLDPLVGQEVYELISNCRTKCQFTGIVISHELPEVFQICDRVAMLLGGEIVIEGTPEDIQTSKNPAVEQFLNGWKDGPIKIQ
jgi:phospholipid/cholesterol/gamma-HCH transport system ATP-binding protein